MVTNKEINEALLKRRGYRQYVGNKDNLSPIMYFFLADASYQIFVKRVRVQSCSGLQSKALKKMKESYHLFFTNFFSAFSPDQSDYIIDKADELEEFIMPHTDIAEIAIQECVNYLPIEIQKEMSAVWLCNLLAADAKDFHGECWKTGTGQPLHDPYLDSIVKAGSDFHRLRFGAGPDLSDKQFDRVQASVKVIANKICDWIFQDYRKEISHARE